MYCAIICYRFQRHRLGDLNLNLFVACAARAVVCYLVHFKRNVHLVFLPKRFVRAEV